MVLCTARVKKMKIKFIAAAIVMATTAAQADSGVQKQIDDLKAGLHQVHLNTLGKYSESWGLEDRANIADLKKDQKRQDEQVSGYVSAQQQRDAGQDDHINAVQGAAQSANEKADGLAVRADGIEKQAGVLDGRVGAVEVRADKLEYGQREQNAQMESDRQQRVEGDAENAKAITAEAQARAEANVKLASGVAVAQSTGDYAKSRADQAYSNAQANSAAIRKTNQQVAQNTAQLANHEQRLGNLESGVNRKFADIDKRMGDIKEGADAAVAGVAAMSNIPQVTGGARFSAGVGVGQRGSQQAVAVGFSSQLTDGVIGKVSVANDTQQQWTVGAGLAVQW